MAGRIACGQDQEHAQSRVNGDDHLEVLGSPAAVPGPPRRPQDGQRVDPEGEDEADDAECERQELGAIRGSHGRSPQVGLLNGTPSGTCGLTRDETPPGAGPGITPRGCGPGCAAPSATSPRTPGARRLS